MHANLEGSAAEIKAWSTLWTLYDQGRWRSMQKTYYLKLSASNLIHVYTIFLFVWAAYTLLFVPKYHLILHLFTNTMDPDGRFRLSGLGTQLSLKTNLTIIEIRIWG